MSILDDLHKEKEEYEKEKFLMELRRLERLYNIDLSEFKDEHPSEYALCIEYLGKKYERINNP